MENHDPGFFGQVGSPKVGDMVLVVHGKDLFVEEGYQGKTLTIILPRRKIRNLQAVVNQEAPKNRLDLKGFQFHKQKLRNYFHLSRNY